MEENIFGRLGREGLTMLLLRSEPIEVVKLCWMTNLRLCDKLHWSLLLQKMFKYPEDEIPVDLKEQRNLFYETATIDWAPFYIPVGPVKKKTYVRNIELPADLNRSYYGNVRYVDAYDCPRVWKLYGFQKTKQGESYWDRRTTPFIDSIGRQLNESSPGQEHNIYYVNARKDDDDAGGDSTYIPSPDGETIWVCFTFLYDTFTITMLLNYADPVYRGEGNLVHKETICNRVAASIIDSENISESELDLYRQSIYETLWRDEYYLDDNGSFAQICQVTFLPIGN